MKQFLLIIALTLLIAGCGRDPEVSFRTHLEIPQTATANQPFTVKASLENVSNRTWELYYGGNLFFFVVLDEKGEVVGKYPTSILFVRQSKVLRPNDEFESDLTNGGDNIQLVIKRPGKYRIRAIAEFSIKKDSTEYQIKSDEKEIKIS
ncbi:MAG: hypothetical protein ACQEXQ_15265 [Bacillota bacterium]